MLWSWDLVPCSGLVTSCKSDFPLCFFFSPVFICFWERHSHSSGWSWTLCTAKNNLELCDPPETYALFPQRCWKFPYGYGQGLLLRERTLPPSHRRHLSAMLHSSRWSKSSSSTVTHKQCFLDSHYPECHAVFLARQGFITVTDLWVTQLIRRKAHWGTGLKVSAPINCPQCFRACM